MIYFSKSRSFAFATMVLIFLFGCQPSVQNDLTEKQENKIEIDFEKSRNDLTFCSVDEDCLITDDRYENGCLSSQGGCSLSSFNKAEIEQLEKKIEADPTICDTYEYSHMLCIPNYLLAPVCINEKCSMVEISLREECKNSWVPNACVSQMDELILKN